MITGPAHDQVLGVVRATGCGAQLSAQIWAATVALSLGGCLSGVPVEVRFDSRVAASIAQPDAESKTHSVVGAIATALWTTAGQSREISLRHVRAHASEPYKELADALVESELRRRS